MIPTQRSKEIHAAMEAQPSTQWLFSWWYPGGSARLYNAPTGQQRVINSAAEWDDLLYEEEHPLPSYLRVRRVGYDAADQPEYAVWDDRGSDGHSYQGPRGMSRRAAWEYAVGMIQDAAAKESA
jgi:hypothetical protein